MNGDALEELDEDDQEFEDEPVEESMEESVEKVVENLMATNLGEQPVAGPQGDIDTEIEKIQR